MKTISIRSQDIKAVFTLSHAAEKLTDELRLIAELENHKEFIEKFDVTPIFTGWLTLDMLFEEDSEHNIMELVHKDFPDVQATPYGDKESGCPPGVLM
jgi:hypothetical protein